MLSNSCRYAIRSVIYLARQPKETGKIGIIKISADLDLPTPFLAKILQQLTRQKILSSSKGPHGGFALLKDPRSITILDIVKSIDGDEIFTYCVMHNGTCNSVQQSKLPCPLHEDYSKVRAELVDVFSAKTIYDIVERANNNENIFI
jgi:Rrf2 family transcriptional regulator, iron-sulfur cluster assembly transcription factor